MAQTLLQLIQQASGELGLAVPVSVVGNPTADTLQLYYLANALGAELLRKYQWQWINKQYIFTVSSTTITGNVTSGSNTLTAASSTVGIDSTYGISGNGINQACYVTGTTSNTISLSQPATGNYSGGNYTLTKVKYAMPSDYDRIIDDTEWDKSKHWRMLGPETAQQWEWLISGYISTGPRIRFRIFGNLFQIWPMVGTPEVLGFEYVSNGWAFSASGAVQTQFATDSDTCVYNDRLMVLGLKKKYLDIKGFDTTVITKDFMDEMDEAKANDAGSPTLSFAPRISPILIGFENLPDSGYGT